MKKFVVSLLCATMVFTLCSCGSEKAASEEVKEEAAVVEVVVETEVDVAAEEADKAFDLPLAETYFCGFTGVPFVPEKCS